MSLGKYAELVTALITAFLIVAAVLSHAFGDSGRDLTFIDAAALLALGAVYGQTSARNGYAREAHAAHTRLDAIGAPPSRELSAVPPGPEPAG